MPTLQEILQDQNYINANPATKKAIFDRWSALDTNYTGANQATQQAIRSRFGVGGIEAAPPAEPPKDKGFFSNVGSLLVEGGKRAIGSAQVSPSVIAGDVSEDKAKLLSEQLSMKPSVQPKELIEAQTAFKDEAEAFEKAKGFTESIGPVAGFLLEFGKQVITNPKGAVYLTAQSAANMAPQIAGMIAGGKGAALAASPAGPQVAALAGAAGAVGGGFAAGVPLEIGSEFIGRIGEKLAERGLEPTEENIAALLRDKAVVEQAISEARTKGVTTAAVDSLMTVGAGKFATGARRSAIDAARKELGDVADAAQIAKRADELLKARTLTQKAGRGAGAVGIETAGGGISEAAGQAAAYGKVDLEDVGAEMLGELGGSAASVPAAAYSTTQDMLKSKAKTDAAKILADEEKARAEAPPAVKPAAAEPSPTVSMEPPPAAAPIAAPLPPVSATPAGPVAPKEPVAPVAKSPKSTDWSNDYTENLPPEAGSFFQNRDRSAPASVGQMQSIAANPDYSRLSVNRDFGSGAPVVISDLPISEDQFGKVAYATASDGTRIPVRYAVVEGNDITPSNTSDGTKNPEYGDLSVTAIRPIAGNGRVAGLRAAYSQGTAENYKRELLEDAEHGINPDIIGGFQNPVLVRVMPKSQVTSNIADISNISGTLRLSPVESAKNDISRVNLGGLTFNDDGSPNTNTLIQFVRSMPKDEQGELIDAKGMPNTKAIDRLNNAIFYKAYGSDTLIELYAQAADPEAKAVLNALAKAAPKMAALDGAGDYDVRASVLDAAEMAVNARRSGQKLKDYVQQGMLGADPYAIKVLEMFADNSRSSKRMAEALDRLATLAGEQAGKSGADMFGDVPKMPKDDLYKALVLEPEAEPDLFAPPVAPAAAAPIAPSPTTPAEPQAIAPAPAAPKPIKPKAAKPAAPKEPEPKEPEYEEADRKVFSIDKPMTEIAKEIQGMTVPELAQWAIDNAPNQAAQAIAQKVSDRINELAKRNIYTDKIKVLNGGLRRKNGVRGRVDMIAFRGSGLAMKISFNGVDGLKADDQTGTRYSTILHELLHAATVAQIFHAPNSKSVNDLQVLYKKVNDQVKKDKASGDRSEVIDKIRRGSNTMQNPAELMAWGLTDTSFQEYLAEIKVGDKTGFQKLVEIVRQVLGLSKDYESALDSLVKITNEMMDVALPDVESEMKASKNIPLKGVKTKGGKLVFSEDAKSEEDVDKDSPADDTETLGQREATQEAEAEPTKSKPARQNIFGEPVLGTWSITVDPKMELQDGLIYKMLDKNIDVKRIVEAVKSTGKQIASQWNPYLQEELYHGRTANASQEFQDKEWLPLLKDMDKKGVTVGELEKYLLNRHAEDYNKLMAQRNPDRPEMQDGASSVNTADARKYLASLDKDTKAKYDELAKRIDGITKGTRQLLADTGYEKAKTIKTWEEMFPNYVPLMREEDDFDYNFASFGTGRGFDVRRDFSRSAMGSKRNVVDIIGNVISARNQAISLTEKNRVAQAVYGLALEAPNPDFWLPINPDLAEVREVDRIKQNIAKYMAKKSDPNITDEELDGVKSSLESEYKKLSFAKTKATEAIERVRRELVDLGIPEETINTVMQEPEQRILDPKKGQVVKRVNTKLRENDHVLATRINGEKRYVFFNPKDPRSKRAATALKNLDAQDLGTALGMVAKITRWMASVNTQYNPIFGPYNFLRDVQSAALQLSTTELAGQQKEIAANVVPSLRVIYSSLRKRRKGEAATGEMADLWKEFQKEGGQTGFRDNFSRTQDRTEALLNEMEKITEGKVKANARAVFDWLSDYNDSLENAVRLSAYKVAKEKFKKEGFSDSEVKQKAASLAKNLTVNFNRKGDVATQMGALYAFFNASMQGTARMVETLKGPMGKRIMAGGLLLGSMQALLLASAGFDDEEPPEFIRSKNIVIPTGDGKYIAFPMPLGFHVIPGISRILTEWTLSGFDDTARRVTDLTGLFLDAFNPIGNAGWSVQTITPTILDPFVALGENKDWTGKPISKEDLFSLRPTPGYTRGREGANWLAEQIAEFLNYASGGDADRKGVLSPTPEQVEYLWGQATGGVGREIAKTITTIDKTITGEELPPYKIPLYGRFVGETKSAAAESNKFYKNMMKLNELQAVVDGRKDRKEPLGKFFQENPEARMLPMANKTYKDVQALRKRRKALVERDAPKESVQAVEKMITRKMQVLNDRVRALEERN